MRLTGKYRYLTFEDRKKIEAWHLLGDRPVDIAARLSVHHTTIYWAKMAAGVKNQTAKWYKTDKERAAKLDAQKRHQ